MAEILECWPVVQDVTGWDLAVIDSLCTDVFEHCGRWYGVVAWVSPVDTFLWGAA